MDSARALIARGWGVSFVSRCLRVSRAQLHVILRRADDWKDGRRSRHTDDTDVLRRIHHVIGELPTYGYRRVWALLRRQTELDGMPAINAKRVYRIMRQNALLLERKPAVPPSKRAHTGRVAVKESNQRWCSDGFEFRCDNGEKLRVTFALDCCDREALHWAVTTGGLNSEIPNLMIGFGIDETQAEYVADIKLRNINKGYILKRIEEIDSLKEEIADMEDILSSERRVKQIIISELGDIAKKYGKPRKTMFIYGTEDEENEAEEEIPDYPVNLFFTREGYFKKITPQSLRMSGEQKLKENDEIIETYDGSNRAELLFFTDKFQVYKARACDFEDGKASVMGDYLPVKLELDPDERIIKMIAAEDYSGTLVMFFENGKCAKVPMASFETKTRRKKLANAYNDGSPLVSMTLIDGDCEFMLSSDAGKVMIFNTVLILPKAARDTQGVQVMRLTRAKLRSAVKYKDGMIKDADSYRTKTVPVAGTLYDEDTDQLKFM